MSGTVYFLPNANQSSEDVKEVRYFCPSTAVSFDSEKRANVWLVDEQQRATNVPVEVGPSRDGRIEILSGISGQERIIRDPKRCQSVSQ